jgi:hypothetical protein
MSTDARTDANQSEIVEALLRAGCTVQLLHQVGGGCPDLVCGYRGVNYLIEVKDGSKTPSRRVLTPQQELWHTLWMGQKAVAKNVEEALAVVGL